jgi:L-methionine (R)-S-oxide reductase
MNRRQVRTAGSGHYSRFGVALPAAPTKTDSPSARQQAALSSRLTKNGAGLMAETLITSESSDKSEQYRTLLPQIEALLADETDLIAAMANVSAMLKMTFDWLWVGFYLVKHQQLVLGPFQGPLACTRIARGKGVCGTAWDQAKTIVVDDVDLFPGHIACSSASRSEIVVPLLNRQGQVAAVLDVDADTPNRFDDQDAQGLAAIAQLMSRLFD